MYTRFLRLLGVTLLAAAGHAWTANLPAVDTDILASITLGALAFADNCQQCHQTDGYGEEKLYPSLHRADLLANKTLLVDTILHGRLGHTTAGDQAQTRLMPSLDFLTDAEIVGIVAYITNSWGIEVLVVTKEDIQRARGGLSR